MSTLESIEKALEGLAEGLDFLKEDIKGPEPPEQNPAAKALGAIEGALKSIAKLFTAFDKKGWWDRLIGFTEFLEELFKFIGSISGGVGFLFQLLGKLLTMGAKSLDSVAEGLTPPQNAVG